MTVIPFRSRRAVNSPQVFRDWIDTSEAANDASPDDILHLAELVPIVRRRLAIGADFSDDALLASLKRIASRTCQRDRWTAAFESNLALWLSSHGRDMGWALNTLIALLPPPRD